MSSRPGSPLVDLLVVFVLVYLVQLVTTAGGIVGGLFVLSVPLSEHPWTILTSVYAHAGPGHLLSNAIALVIFGWPVARATTRLRFHAFFLMTGAIAGISQILLTSFLAEGPVVGDLVAVTPGISATATAGVLGASGGVFALLGYLLTGNRISAGLGSLVLVPAWVKLLVFVGIAGLLTLATADPGVALVAHFTGLLLGLVAGSLNLLAPEMSVRGGRGAGR